MIKGIQKICPNIPNSKTIEFDGDGEVSASVYRRPRLAGRPPELGQDRRRRDQ